jgi:hypothetical protein
MILCRAGISMGHYSWKSKLQTKNKKQFLRHYATSRKAAGSNPDEVIGFFN